MLGELGSVGSLLYFYVVLYFLVNQRLSCYMPVIVEASLLYTNKRKDRRSGRSVKALFVVHTIE